MKYLAICIPNYNRPDKLRRLLLTSAERILRDSIEDQVEICISDDCSVDDPTDMVQSIQTQYPTLTVRYKRNRTNMGMDYNFLSSVLLSDSLYCWIIGNDDLPTEDGIKAVLKKLKERNGVVDLMVTPFDVIDSADSIINTIYPLKLDEDDEIEFHTDQKENYEELLWKVCHNSGLFGFLSNVVFKRERWEKYYTRFNNKIGTIFIQMYMNIQSLEEGALYLYSPQKIIVNYSDNAVNESVKRVCDILLGLDGVIEYFYYGEIKKHLKKVIVDTFISGMTWEAIGNDEYKKKIRHINSEKSEIYKKFFIEQTERKTFFRNKNVILFGAGNYGRKALKSLVNCHANIIAVIDSDPAKFGNMIGEYRIQAAAEIKSIYKREDTCIVIANHQNLVEMVRGLLNQEIKNLAIIT